MINMVCNTIQAGIGSGKGTAPREILPKITNTAAREIQDSGIV